MPLPSFNPQEEHSNKPPRGNAPRGETTQSLFGLFFAMLTLVLCLVLPIVIAILFDPNRLRAFFAVRPLGAATAWRRLEFRSTPRARAGLSDRVRDQQRREYRLPKHVEVIPATRSRLTGGSAVFPDRNEH